jgi:DNA-damage-inducible protein J
MLQMQTDTHPGGGKWGNFASSPLIEFHCDVIGLQFATAIVNCRGGDEIIMDDKQKNARINIRVDPQLRAAANKVFTDMGMDMATAVRMFLTQTVRDNALPFQPSALPAHTQQALSEREHAEDYHSYTTLADVTRDLDTDD